MSPAARRHDAGRHGPTQANVWCRPAITGLTPTRTFVASAKVTWQRLVAFDLEIKPMSVFFVRPAHHLGRHLGGRPPVTVIESSCASDVELC